MFGASMRPSLSHPPPLSELEEEAVVKERVPYKQEA